jgi:hypothetical protein
MVLNGAELGKVLLTHLVKVGGLQASYDNTHVVMTLLYFNMQTLEPPDHKSIYHELLRQREGMVLNGAELGKVLLTHLVKVGAVVGFGTRKYLIPKAPLAGVIR